MTYKEYKKDRENQANKLPIFWAFSDRQFEEAMKIRGLTTNDEDLKKICRVTAGGYCLKTDVDKIHAFFDSDNIEELMKDPEFAYSAFRYEMDNHEYAINYQGDWDVCSCFFKCEYDSCKTGPDYLREHNCDEEIIKAYNKARSEHRRRMSNYL